MKLFEKFSKSLNQKKGFTLVELLVVMIIIGFVGTMAAQLFHYIFRDYKKVEMRWEIQQEVQYIMSMFTGNSERLSTTTTCSIFYDPEGNLLPEENTEVDPTYSYFYAKPRDINKYNIYLTKLKELAEKDEWKGKSLAELKKELQKPDEATGEIYNYTEGFDLYYRGRGTTENIKLNSESTHVGIEFNLSSQLKPLFTDKKDGNVKLDEDKSNPQKYVTMDYDIEVTDYVTNKDGEKVKDENGNDITEWKYIPKGSNQSSYNNTTLDITVGSSTYYASYFLTSSFNLNNMSTAGSIINFDGGSLTGTWEDDNYLGVNKHSLFYKAENGKIKEGTGDNSTIISGVSLAGYTDAKANETYMPVAQDEISKEKNNKYNETGNVLRFISIQSFMTSDRVPGVAGSALNQDSHCFLTNSISGSIFENQILNSLRGFRDNVLSKSDFGKTVISDYYNVVSPFFNKKLNTHPVFYKLLGKAVAYPAATIYKIFHR